MANPSKHDLYRMPVIRLLSARFRAIPDYIILGAQKAGTTTIYDNLVKHPEVAACDIKEVHFFDNNWQRGQGWYRAHFPLVCNKLRAISDGQPWVTGEGSPYYLFHPQVPARLKAACPNAKLIIVLRNPIDRAYSHYQHERRKDREPLTFEQAIDAEPERLTGETERIMVDPNYSSFAHQHYSYLARGHYADQLEQWFKLFPREQFFITDTAELNKNFESCFTDLQKFLGLNKFDVPAPRRSNVGSYDKLAPETRQRLADYYAPHNARLEQLLGRTFNWD